jgi:hypothetical protein
VVEATGLKIPWMEPRDLEWGTFPLAVNPQDGLGISAEHYRRGLGGTGMATVVMGDGSVRQLFGETPPEEFQAILAGGED